MQHEIICGIGLGRGNCELLTGNTNHQLCTVRGRLHQSGGHGTITGQAFLRRNDGIVVYGAGSGVGLIPATAYARERMASIYGGGKYAVWHAGFKNDDPAYQAYMKKTVADGEGRFKFENVADGTYFITTTVTWFVQYQQGGALMETVTVSGGKSIDVIMSGQ